MPTRRESAPFQAVRWLPTSLGPEDLTPFPLPTGSRIAHDGDKNPVALFPTEWSSTISHRIILNPAQSAAPKMKGHARPAFTRFRLHGVGDPSSTLLAVLRVLVKTDGQRGRVLNSTDAARSGRRTAGRRLPEQNQAEHEGVGRGLRTQDTLISETLGRRSPSRGHSGSV